MNPTPFTNRPSPLPVDCEQASAAKAGASATVCRAYRSVPVPMPAEVPAPSDPHGLEPGVFPLGLVVGQVIADLAARSAERRAFANNSLTEFLRGDVRRAERVIAENARELARLKGEGAR